MNLPAVVPYMLGGCGIQASAGSLIIYLVLLSNNIYQMYLANESQGTTSHPNVRPHTERAVLGGNETQTCCGFTDMLESKMCHLANTS